ncbi:MAG: FAD-dependent oxidoreductase [Veillonellales bacterium]
MSDDEKFDAIIIGAGPAGAACAYLLAKAGKSVILIERGSTAGEKNVTGGRLYTYALELVEPGLYKQAPLQRKVIREQIVMMSQHSAMTMDYVDYDFGAEMPQSFTVLRATFDEWFAAQAEEQGAMLAAGILVEDLIEERGRIIGVRAGDDEIYANVVIAADGVNSFIAQKAGLRGDITADSVGVCAKEVIELPPEVIEARFNLSADEGVARVMSGGTDGVPGGAFLYTNKDSISLGVVVNPVEAARKGKKVQEMLQDLKMHPAVYPFLKEGTTVEYGAHLVSELGLNVMPKKLYRDGLLLIGDAAGFVINTGTMVRGIDLAIVSGVAAARAVLANEGSANVGTAYLKELEDLALLPTMRLYAKWHDIVGNPRMAATYPNMLNEMIKIMFFVDGKLPKRIDKAMLSIVRKHVSIGQLAADGWKGFRAI